MPLCLWASVHQKKKPFVHLSGLRVLVVKKKKGRSGERPFLLSAFREAEVCLVFLSYHFNSILLSFRLMSAMRQEGSISTEVISVSGRLLVI